MYTLNLFRKIVNISDQSSYFLFYYPKDMLKIKSDFDYDRILYQKESRDFNRRLEPHHVNKLFSIIIGKGIDLGINDRLSPWYFYDARFGYCTCNALIDHKKNKSDKSLFHTWCNCIAKIKYLDKNWYDITIEEEILISLIYGKFPEGFVEVLESDYVMFAGYPLYIISSLNVMDIKQVSANVFEVGIVITVIEYISDFRNRSSESEIAKDIKKSLTYINDLVTSHYEKNKELYLQKSTEFITNWINSGLISKDDLFVHLGTSYNNPTDPVKQEHRYYILLKDYETHFKDQDQTLDSNSSTE